MTQPQSDEVASVALRDGVAILTLSRPAARNAINGPLRSRLAALLRDLSADAQVRALVLTGAGEAFCAGGDISAMRARLEAPPGQVAAQGWRHQRTGTHHVVVGLHDFEKPTVAAVNGAAAGLGADLALACDFIAASDRAAFIYSYAHRGLIPDGGGMHFLPRRVGLSKAKELVFMGRTVKAEEALGMGLVDRVTPAADLLDDAVRWAKELSQLSPTAVALAKSIMNRTFETSLEDTLALGAQAQAICYSTDEHRSAVTRFFEERGPASRAAAAAKS